MRVLFITEGATDPQAYANIFSVQSSFAALSISVSAWDVSPAFLFPSGWIRAAVRQTGKQAAARELDRSSQSNIRLGCWSSGRVAWRSFFPKKVSNGPVMMVVTSAMITNMLKTRCDRIPSS
jgi:hypothetical protein